ncbi:protein O-glucosyltransferase 3 isoform X1 [Electrophorus electricus]|uniref:protein O-glucosyltransferase 3 isoform X1 n=1 Tax=Electrophorus electricus TaxID=8005 RepID=UPI0015CF9AC0|nr:protein O-glucosyltransferase 3 isoform X1 [Electrophorus electricus]
MVLRRNVSFSPGSAVAVCIVAILAGGARLACCQDGEIIPEQCVIWGPGLHAQRVLPVRYFYIQAVGPSGKHLRVSPGKDSFKVKISSLSQTEHVRIHAPPPLDRGDGSFLIRFRMYGSSVNGLKVEVFYKDKLVGQSPYILKGPVYHEYCSCPEADAEAWQQLLQCPAEEPQIQTDFSPFSSIDLQRLREEVPRRFSNRGGLLHYTILNNQVYRRSLGRYTDFRMFSDEMLLSLARKVQLPDVEFFLNVGDWPLETRKLSDVPGPLPIISWCGSTDTRDIVLPTYDITHSTLETLRGVSNDLLSIQGNTGPAWANKTSQAFFRGRDSREERLNLVAMSQKHPDLLDAGITAFFFFREREKELGKAPLVGFFDFFKFKYQVNVDGTVAAYRFPYLMLGNSLVLKQDSSYYEHFYTHLYPGRHYIPVRRTLDDLIQKIQWAKDNDEEAEAVAKAGQEVAREVLQPHRLYCYYYTVLKSYASRQSGKPVIHGDMELVPQPSDGSAACSCEKRTATQEPRRESDEL